MESPGILLQVWGNTRLPGKAISGLLTEDQLSPCEVFGFLVSFC